MHKIAMFGVGYVGLVTGTCFAELGNSVICMDTDEKKIATLRGGEIPFFEPGLSEMVARNVAAGRLGFTTSATKAVEGSDIIFVAVGTPMGADGHADLSYVREAVITIARAVNAPKIVVNKSTVPVETGDLVAGLIDEHRTSEHIVHVVSNPEFVREGSAIADFMTPDRIVLGVSDGEVAEVMRSLYAPLNAPVILTDVRTAEMIKYAANAFLATKISFINEIAQLCERVGADVRDVVLGAGSDHRIGSAFLQPGLGFGGSCFPKDVMALARIAESRGMEPRMLRAVQATNEFALEQSFTKINERFGGTLEGRVIAYLGLSFKPNTDDIRESPALALAVRLQRAGATLRAHDPIAVENARPHLEAEYVSDPYDAAEGADALVVATDWNEYKQLDLAQLDVLMRSRLIFDLRNVFNLHDAVAAGFTVIGVGRQASPPAHRFMDAPLPT